MNPTASDVHVNGPLTTMSVAMIQSAKNFVASQVFPTIPVAKQSDVYFEYDRGEFNRDEARERAPATRAAAGTYDVETSDPYYCRQYSFAHDIPDPRRANADSALMPDREATMLVTHKALLRREVLFAQKYMATGVWGEDKTGVAGTPNASQVKKWSDSASTPIQDVSDGKTAVFEKTGIDANTICMGRRVYDNLKNHPEVIDRVKYGQTAGGPAMATFEAIRQLLDIERMFVMNAIQNTAKKGQTAVHSLIGGNGLLLCHSAREPGLMTPSAGYTFAWTGLLGSSAEGGRIRKFRMDPEQCDRVEIDLCFDQRRIASDLGMFFADLV